MTKLLLPLLLLATLPTYGQVKDPFPYKFSESIYSNIKKDSVAWRGGVTSSDLSFIGLYKEAVMEWDKARPAIRVISPADSLHFVSAYQQTDARSFILKKAKENRVVIFNEAHFNPRHRVFVTSLLKDLKKLGYTHFAAETFSTRPSFQQNSKYPNLNSGYYAMEPQFGNLIRTANELGYALYPYESATGGNVDEREIKQARNLSRLLDSVPNSKLIIYCGFDHAMEDTVQNWGVPMAARLKEFTGINPFTIDQIVLSERSSARLDNPYFRLINARRYTIMTDKNGNPFNKRLDNKKIDALLYSPPTQYRYNRPDWVFENGKKPYLLNKDSVHISYPLLAKVYFTETDIENMVIPIDIIEIRNEQELATTALAVFKKKKFVVQLIDTKGNEQVIQGK